MTETEINFSTETTWLQSDGSLDNTLIFTTESPPEGQEIESRPLLLTPSQNSSAPCEITLKFEGSCEIFSVYVRSTARIFELYNKSESSADNEYVCTARGELAMQNDDPICVKETINKDDNSSFGRDSHIGNFTKSSQPSPIKNEAEPFLNVDDCDRESSSCPSQSDSIDGNTDETLQNLLHDSIRVSEAITKKGSQSSDEDSWVEVKLSGSLVVDSLGKPGGMFQLQSMDYKDHSEDKAAQKAEILAKHSGRIISEDDRIELGQNEHKSPEGAPWHAKEEKLSNVGVSNKLIVNDMDNKARADDNLVRFSTNRIAKEALYEADVEIVNAIPCVSLTIRLLSLQDKSCVEIDAICIYGLHSNAVKDRTETISSASSSLQGSPFGGSLLAMLLPSMLQMSRGRLTQSQDEFLCNVRTDKSMLQIGSSESQLLRSCDPSIVSTPLSEKDVEASKGGNLSSDRVPRKKGSAELSLLQEKLRPYLDEVGENLELTKNNLIPTVQNAPPYIGPTCDIKGRQNNMGGGNSCMGGMTGANEIAASSISGPYNEESNKHYIPEELESKKIDNCLSKKINGDNMLEHLCERMDRVEALCLRIEDYLHRSFDNMERRIQLVESYQMLQNHSLMTKTETDTVCSDFPVLSNSFFSTSISGMEMLNNGNWKHMAAVDTPNLPCAEVPSSISMPRAGLVSSPNCFPLSAIVSPTTLPPDASCMGVSKDLDSENTDSSHCTETSKGRFDKSPNLVLEESASRSLDQQDLLKEKNLGDDDSQSAEHIGVYAGSEVSSKPINKARPCLEEALASALTAFSVSAHPAQVETTCILTEIPSSSSRIENADEKEGCDHEGLHSSQVETTGLCSGIPCQSLEVGNLNEVCYHDDTSFNMFEGVRYISQENMDSVPYSSSQGSKDAKQTVYRGKGINDAQDVLALTIKQSCEPGTKIAINDENKIRPLEDDNENKLHNNEMTLAVNVFCPIHVNQSARSCVQEANMVHDHLEQLQPLQELYEFESSKLCPEPTNLINENNQNMVEEKYASFSPLSVNTENHLAGIERIITCLGMEDQVELTVGSDGSTEAHDKHASRKLHIDSSSLLDISFTTSNALQTKMSLESLLCDDTPEQGRQNVPLQKTSEAETSNFTEPKRPHGLFFVEDEGLGEFIIPGASTLLCSVTAGNTSKQGMVPGVSPGFESLL